MSFKFKFLNRPKEMLPDKVTDDPPTSLLHLLILVGRNPQNMKGGASTWILNMDRLFRKDYQIDYLIVPEKWLNMKFIPDRIKASIQALFVLCTQRRKWDIFISHSPELSYYATIFSKNVVHIAHGNTNPMETPTFKVGKIFYNLFDFFVKRVEAEARLLYTVGEPKIGYSKLNQPINHSIKPVNYNEKTNLIFAGRLEKIKNVDYIIKAYALLDKNVRNKNKLYIYGSGGEERNLKKLIENLDLKEYVYLMGHIPNIDLITAISSSSILVMASSFEGFPMVIAEALTVGTPVITTDVGSISDVVKDGYNGYLIPIGSDQEVFAEKIALVLKNMQAFSKNALCSSIVFNAREVYNQIKNDLNRTFPRR